MELMDRQGEKLRDYDLLEPVEWGDLFIDLFLMLKKEFLKPFLYEDAVQVVATWEEKHSLLPDTRMRAGHILLTTDTGDDGNCWFRVTYEEVEEWVNSCVENMIENPSSLRNLHRDELPELEIPPHLMRGDSARKSH
jgi:hypothetical protein